MDSPELIPPSFLTRNTMSQRKEIPDDSGYITVTPSSAESTGIGEDVSRSLSLCRSLHRSSRMDLSYLAVSHTSGTPNCETNMYGLSPMNISDKADINLDSDVSFLDASSNILSSTRIFPPSHPNNLSFMKETTPRPNKLSKRKSLNRQDGFEMEWSSESDVIPVFNNKYFNLNTPDRENCVKKESLLSVESLNSFPTLQIDLNKIQTNIKEKAYCDGIHRTPKKNGVSKTSIVIKSQRPVKKIFPTLSIGTPEKNKLLYSELKSVSPPKKCKPFEKLRFSPEKENSPIMMLEPMKRDLYWRGNYCGLDKVDFIRLFSSGYQGLNKKILGFLFEKDIFNASQVNSTWKSACLIDKVSCERLMNYEETTKNNKENLTMNDRLVNFSKYNKQQLRHKSNSVELVDIQNLQNILIEKKPTRRRSPSVSPRSKRFYKFTKAASQSDNDGIRCCPRCNSAAKLSGQWGVCQGLTCNFTFCGSCLNAKKHCQKSTSCPNSIKAASPSKDSPVKTNLTQEKRRKSLRRLLL